MVASKKRTASPYDIKKPSIRRLKIFSVDPSLAHSLDTRPIKTTTVDIPWETTLDPGPCGEYVEVVDYDPYNDIFYKPVDLDDRHILAQDGLNPSDGNPQFHQQMVYAVAMRTIKNFERALGRRAMWASKMAFSQNPDDEFVRKLRIYPHALREANAYYSGEKKALLMGYFQAMPEDASVHLPGGMVFTCLSHDIIAHETTHALLDGMHRRFTEASNPDVLAFHEAFADIVAIFQHFTFPDVVKHEIAKSQGRLSRSEMLASLAREFGHAIGRSDALRNALGTQPNTTDILRLTEPHDRGAILVAAVFRAFLLIYEKRTTDLYRLATNGSGLIPDGAAIHPDLVERLAGEAMKSAQHVLTICIRALDYMPPVDITFGDYLRAIITADSDLLPNDRYGYRTAFIEAFRKWGLYPDDVKSMSEESLKWESVAMRTGYSEDKLRLGDNLVKKMQKWDLSSDRLDIFKTAREIRSEVHEIMKNIAKTSDKNKQDIFIGLDMNRAHVFEVHSVRPVRRSGPDGQWLMDAVIEVTQRRPGFVDKQLNDCRPPVKFDKETKPDFWFRGGCTLIIDMATGKIRYCIYKDINSKNRYKRQTDYVSGENSGFSLSNTYFKSTANKAVNNTFDFIHRIR